MLTDFRSPSSLRSLAAPVLAAAVLAGCGGSVGEPDGVWQVSVVSTEASDFGSACAQDAEYSLIEDQFSYELYQEGSAIQLRIDGEVFAAGAFTSGCTIEYDSPAWLDEFNGAEIQWQLEGNATIDGAAGGCVDDQNLDWQGSETITVIRSDTDALPVGCTRSLTVTGVRAN